MLEGPRRGSILLVEDNSDLSDNLVEILEDAGYQVGSAASCDEARRLAQGGFDVALVDVRLPDGDGIQLAPQLKSMAPDAEVILLTGFATLESAMGAVRAGAWAYLVKPCAPADLLIALSQALRQVRLQRDARELARRAQFSEKLAALGTMAAGLAHEIRNPLNAAQLQLGLAERRVRASQSEESRGALEALALVREEMGRLNQLVEEVLAFSRPGALNPVTADLAQTVSTVARFLGPDAISAGVTLHVEGVEQACPVRYDEGRIKQVLANLVRNGVEAAGPVGQVWVRLARRGETVELRVEDSGPGVPVGVDPFVPFFTTKQLGTGLGLPTAHRIVSEHGGTLQVERAGPRTAFVALLPVGGP